MQLAYLRLDLCFLHSSLFAVSFRQLWLDLSHPELTVNKDFLCVNIYLAGPVHYAGDILKKKALIWFYGRRVYMAYCSPEIEKKFPD